MLFYIQYWNTTIIKYIEIIEIMTARYKWVKQTENVQEVIESNHDAIKEWNPDKKGYFLIRITNKRIEVGYVTNKHVISKMIYGTNAIELYNTLIRNKLVSKLEHAAYLGKELYKAELALKYGKMYKQEMVLSFLGKKFDVKDS